MFKTTRRPDRDWRVGRQLLSREEKIISAEDGPDVDWVSCLDDRPTNFHSCQLKGIVLMIFLSASNICTVLKRDMIHKKIQEEIEQKGLFSLVRGFCFTS